MILIRVSQFKIVEPVAIEVTMMTRQNPGKAGELITTIKLALKLANGDTEYIGGDSQKEIEELWDSIFSAIKQKRRVFDYYKEEENE